MGCLPIFVYFLAMSHVDWPTTKVKTLNWEAPHKNNLYVSIKYFSPLAHLYWWEGEHFGQRIWYKVRCFGNTLQTWGTSLWTCWKHKNKRIPNSSTSPTKGKRWILFIYVHFSRWFHVYFILRHGCYHFFALINIPFTEHTIPIG